MTGSRQNSIVPVYWFNVCRGNEWWISDLAKELGVIAVKIHYWVKHG